MHTWSLLSAEEIERLTERANSVDGHAKAPLAQPAVTERRTKQEDLAFASDSGCEAYLGKQARILALERCRRSDRAEVRQSCRRLNFELEKLLARLVNAAADFFTCRKNQM